jgi:cell wall-associated NlpC family hydrolase
VRYTDPDGFRQIEAAQTYGDEFIASDGTVRSSHYLDERVAEISKTFVGGAYDYGGKTPSGEGGTGIDCSRNAMLSAERASGVTLRPRNVIEMRNDRKLLLDGYGGPGSVNFYDWKPGGGVPDHVTVVEAEKKEVHPSSNTGTIRLVDHALLESFADSVVNKRFNWLYILGEK